MSGWRRGMCRCCCGNDETMCGCCDPGTGRKMCKDAATACGSGVENGSGTGCPSTYSLTLEITSGTLAFDTSGHASCTDCGDKTIEGCTATRAVSRSGCTWSYAGDFCTSTSDVLQYYKASGCTNCGCLNTAMRVYDVEVEVLGHPTYDRKVAVSGKIEIENTTGTGSLLSFYTISGSDLGGCGCAVAGSLPTVHVHRAGYSTQHWDDLSVMCHPVTCSFSGALCNTYNGTGDGPQVTATIS